MTAVSAIAAAAAAVLALVLDFAIVPQVLDLIGAGGVFYGFTTLWWVSVVASLMVLAALIAGWRLDRPAWAPGVTEIALGLVVWWGWLLLNRYVDLWGLARTTEEQADQVTVDTRLIAISYLATIVHVAVVLLAVVLLAVGARRLLRASAERPVPSVS